MTASASIGEPTKNGAGIQVTWQPRRRGALWLPVVVLASAGIHLAVAMSTSHLERLGPREYGASQVEVQVRARPEQKVTPAPKPEPKPAPKPLAPKPRPKRAFKPNVEPPPAAPAPETPAPKPVFGVTADSVTTDDSGVAVRQGNTLARKMERRFVPTWAAGPAAPAPPPPKKKALPQPIPSYKLTRAPSFAHKVEPDYPEAARQRGLHGTVLLEVLIDARGKIRSVRVIRSPDERLSRAAVAAIRKSRMNPGLVGTRAVPVKLKIPYRFVLDS